MIRAITFTPASRGSGGLAYVERASRNRSLHVLLQDCRTSGAATTPASRQNFLQGAYREIISRYVSFGRIEHPLPMARTLVSFLDSLSHRIDCRMDDFRGIGFFLLFQDGNEFFLLDSREGRARIRTSEGFETLAAHEIPGVTELPVESSSAQKELFSRDLKDFLALYRIDTTRLKSPSGTLDLALGGSGEEMDTLIEALEQPGVIENSVAEKTIPLNLISQKMMYLSFDGVVKARDLYAEQKIRTRQTRGIRRTGIYTASAIVVLLFVVSGAVWLSSRISGSDARPDQTASVDLPGLPGGAGGGDQETLPAGEEDQISIDPPAGVESSEAPVQLSLNWSRSYSGGVTSSPLLEKGKVVFGGRNGILYALGTADGEVAWRHRASSGIGASPAIAGRLVLAADYAGNVFAVDIDTGKRVWQRKLPGKIVSSPILGEGEALIGCFDGKAYALSVETGRILWRVSTGGKVRGTAAFADGVFYVPSYSGKLYAISAGTGSVRWTYNLVKPVSSSPAVDGSTVVVGGAQGGVYALDTTSGKLLWKFDTNQPVKSFISIENDRVYCGANNGALYCLEIATGRQVWRFDTGGPILGRPVVVGRAVVFPSYDGHLYCVDAATGEEIDRFDSGDAVFSSPAFGDDRVYFGNNEGKFYCLGLRSGGAL